LRAIGSTLEFPENPVKTMMGRERRLTNVSGQNGAACCWTCGVYRQFRLVVPLEGVDVQCHITSSATLLGS
jgi:hypothetical protein